ncbi:MAG: sugar phosphate isomerase/epimerase family protein [Syntrophorhabdales bacterium]
MQEKMFGLCSFVVLAVLVFLGTAQWGVAAMRPFLISAVHFDAELKSGKMSVLDLAPLAVKYVAQGVEYRDIYWKDKAKELSAVRDQTARLKLIVTYTTVTTLYSNDTQKQARLLADIEDAQALSAPLLRVNLGVRPAAGPEAAGQREAVRKAIEFASRLGVKLALENNSAAPGEQLSDIKATLEELNSPVLGTNMDFANYATTGQNPLNAIQALAPWIIYVHAKDAEKTDRGWRTTYLGGGTLPLREILAALDKTGRSFLFCLEYPGAGDPEGGLVKSRAYLADDK